MPNKQDNDVKPNNDIYDEDQPAGECKVENGRRRAVRNILAGSGITAAAAAGNWSKPLVDTVITPAHAQTSTLTFVLAGNADLTASTTAVERNANSVLDFFVGAANAQEVGPDLGGACLTMTVTDARFDLDFEFVSDPAITVSGTISGDAFSGSGSGISVSGTVDLAGAVQTAIGSASNAAGTYGFTIDSNTISCEPLSPTTTPAPTTPAPTTTVGSTTTSAPTTTPV